MIEGKWVESPFVSGCGYHINNALRDLQGMGLKHILERREVLFFFISGIVVSAPLTLYAENLVNQLCMFFRLDGDPYLVLLCGVLAIPIPARAIYYVNR